MKQPKTFGSELRRLRIKNGYSQQALSDETGIPAQTISSYETGHRKPRWPQMMTLAEYLGISLDGLVG